LGLNLKTAVETIRLEYSRSCQWRQFRAIDDEAVLPT
jgi:hypothetical protein